METEFGSMKPKQLSLEEKAEAEAVEKKKNLESQSTFLGVANSEAQKVLVNLLNKKLIERISELCGEDPEASFCLKILQELGVQTAYAEQAAKELEEMYLKSDQK